jgi:6-pyruvoyltetrahydropterin/6-carboxytetrahydropterin synthase
MYSIKVESSFSSAHNLRGYKGKCEELHGHNWKVEAVLKSSRLDKAGMLVDFTVVKKHLVAVLEELDHKYLNKVPYFSRVNPTSENIAYYIYKKLRSRRLKVSAVTVWENATSAATYHG